MSVLKYEWNLICQHSSYSNINQIQKLAGQLRKQITNIRHKLKALFSAYFPLNFFIRSSIFYSFLGLSFPGVALCSQWGGRPLAHCMRNAMVSPMLEAFSDCIYRKDCWRQNVPEARPLNLLSKGPKSSVHSSWVILSKWWVNIVWEQFSFIKILSMNFAI